MTKLVKATTAALLAVTMTACDYAVQHEFKTERSDRAYRAAMDDYRAGRIREAVRGLEKVCQADPANASARFQLACLLQDAEKDYLGAVCAYREYILQQPASKKAALAKERLAVCERELAKELATRFGLNAAGSRQREIEALESSLKSERERAAKGEKDLAVSMQRVAALVLEVERLKKFMTSAPTAGGAGQAAEIRTARDLLDEDGEAAPAAVAEVKEAKELAEEGDGVASPQMSAAEAKALADEDDKFAGGVDILHQPKEAKARREAARQARESSRKAEPLHEKRPDHYVVQDGDTLYKIAMRFYGTSSAWSRIRDANKATISMDGRVRRGQRIVLPE